MDFKGPLWEGVYSSFSEVPVAGPGFDGEEWVSNSLKKMVWLRDELQKSHPLPPMSNYREALLPFLVSLHHHQNGSVRILDFGGGIGFTYFQTIYGMPQTREVDYHIVARAVVCQAGREFFGAEQHQPIFHNSLEEIEGKFDIIYLGSVLQYIEDWYSLLKNLCKFQPSYLLLADIYAGNIPTFASGSYYYGDRIPSWFLNIHELLDLLKAIGYELMFKSVYQPTILGSEQVLPLDNIEEKYRLKRTCNLVFIPMEGKCD